MRYIIGIDAGGTKTTATAFSETGEALGFSRSGFGNLAVDFTIGMEHICETIDELIQKIGDGCEFICLGCAGMEEGNLIPRTEQYLSGRYGCKAHATNDGLLAHYAILNGQDGVLVIGGTGAIAYLKKGKKLRRFGGWGHLINDDGSGYSIAMRAVRYLTFSYDTEHFETPLKKAIFDQLNLKDIWELIDFIYSTKKGEVASIVPTIEQLANEGDEQARSILSWAGEKLAYLVINLCRQNDLYTPRVAISGSVIRKTAMLKEVFCDTIKENIGDFTLIDDDIDPAKGSYYIWLEQTK